MMLLYNKWDKNLNTGFYKDLDTNFERAYELCSISFTHTELLQMISTGNIPEKQIAALKFDYINSVEDAKALLSVLTGCDGKIREAAAHSIYRFISENPDCRMFFCENFAKTFADATIDINANICRLVVDSVTLLKTNNKFADLYTGFIIDYTLQALDELDKFIFRDKKYVINKQLFKLYWCLEALRFFYDRADTQVILDILERSSAQNEYTIREKAAQIAILSEKFIQIAEKLKNDENYYVRMVFQPINKL